MSCGPALWRKLRAEDGPEARDLGRISCRPSSPGKDKVPAPRLYGWEGALLSWSAVLPSGFPEFAFLPSGLLKGLSQQRTVSVVPLTQDLLTWVPRRPCRAPRRRRTCPESCPRRDERQVGPSCLRAAITASSRRAAAPRMSCALVFSCKRDGRETRPTSKGMLIAGGDP